MNGRYKVRMEEIDKLYGKQGDDAKKKPSGEVKKKTRPAADTEAA